MENCNKETYYQLEILEDSATTEIWLGDDEGHFVQKGVGVLRSSLRPGHYTVEFGLGSACYVLHLNGNSSLQQIEVESGPPCDRPVPKI